jgi:hypothetical protein
MIGEDVFPHLSVAKEGKQQSALSDIKIFNKVAREKVEIMIGW